MTENNDDIKAIKAELDTATENLNLKIIEFENYLRDIHLGVEAWTKVSDNVFLGYGKHQGKWKLKIRYLTENEKSITNSLIECPRGLRFHGYKHRELIIPALLETAKSLTEKINKAINNDRE